MGSYSLPDGNDLIVTIRTTTTEQVINLSGKKDDCLVIYFAESDKPMILNRTNARTIEKLTGSPYLEDWIGARIQLYVQRDVKAFGTTTDAIRIRDFHPKTFTPDPTKIIQTIRDCNSLNDLKILYSSLPNELKAHPSVIREKDLRKTTLTNSKS